MTSLWLCAISWVMHDSSCSIMFLSLSGCACGYHSSAQTVIKKDRSQISVLSPYLFKKSITPSQSPTHRDTIFTSEGISRNTGLCLFSCCLNKTKSQVCVRPSCSLFTATPAPAQICEALGASSF